MTSGHHDPRDLRVAEEAPERETEAVSSSHYHEQGTHLAGFWVIQLGLVYMVSPGKTKELVSMWRGEVLG